MLVKHSPTKLNPLILPNCVSLYAWVGFLLLLFWLFLSPFSLSSSFCFSSFLPHTSFSTFFSPSFFFLSSDRVFPFGPGWSQTHSIPASPPECWD